MNSKQFTELLHNVNKSIFWKDFLTNNNDMVKHIEKRDNFKYLNNVDLFNSIELLKSFDINLLWDKSFWGLKKHESISAIASEPYNTLKRLKY